MRYVCLIALPLAACVSYAPITTPSVAVQSRLAGAVGADALAGQRLAAGGAPAFLGTETIELRARTRNSELVGATCDVETSFWTARVTTPARLTIPDYGPNSPDITAICRRGGLTATGVAEIEDTREDEDRSGFSIGTDGSDLTGAIRLVLNTRPDDPATRYRYPDLIVSFH